MAMPAPCARYGRIGCAASPSSATLPWACCQAPFMGGRSHSAHRRQSGMAAIRSCKGAQVCPMAVRRSAAEEFRAALESYTPERVTEITGVPSEQLHRAAEILSRNRPMAIMWSMGITQHTTGVINVLALGNLQMLLGNMELGGGVKTALDRIMCRAPATWVPCPFSSPAINR